MERNRYIIYTHPRPHYTLSLAGKREQNGCGVSRCDILLAGEVCADTQMVDD